jgi:FkbM family methyltransferase
MDLNQVYDQQTIEIMKRILKKDSNCLDIGCHQGAFLSEMLKLAPSGTHSGFEPLPHMFQDLKKTFGKMSNVRLYNCALSDSTGPVTFQHVVSNPGYSGLRKRRYDREDELIQEITVNTELLDNIVERDFPIRFIKIDVEGAELQVLRGAAETIKASKPVIVFEHGLGAADFYGTTPEDIFDLLVNICGLRLFTLGEWLESAGRKSLGREDFCDHFYSGRHYYFCSDK